MKFGLVGTGYWARVTHAPALSSTAGVELAAVWGRNPQAAADLAAEYRAATQAARAGKHLLLEKPVALTEAAADGLVEAVEQAGVASVVFFTNMFQPDV